MLTVHMLVDIFSPMYLVIEIFFLLILLEVKYSCDYFLKPWVVLVNQNSSRSFSGKYQHKYPSSLLTSPVNINVISIYRVILDDSSRNNPGDDSL